MIREKALVAVLAANLSCSLLAATTYYADNVNGSESYDGLSAAYDGAHGPKAKIQSAVELCAAGDTVVVAPGIYGDDQGKVAATSGYHACRVYIDKAITLKSSGGREATHIVGNYVKGASASTEAVGGVVIAAEAAGTVVQGFTIRGCGTSKLGSANPIGGAAVYCKLDAATAMSGMPWVTDCAINDCYSYCAAVKYVNVARTIITHCRATSVPTVADYCNLAYCIVAHNGDIDVNNSHLLRGTKDAGAAANYVINCTIQDNARNATSTAAPRYVYNTIFWQAGIYSPVAENSIFSVSRGGMGNSSNPVEPSSTNSTATSVFSKGDGVTAGPAVDDYRLVRAASLENASVADSPAIDIGASALLDALPEEYRSKDCYGNDVTPVNGRIHAGAVQMTMTPVSGFAIAENGGVIAVNGVHGVLTNITSTVYTDVWPVCYGFRADNAETLTASGSKKPFFGYLVQNGTVPNRYLFPDSNEQIPFVPEKGRLMDICPYRATHVLYVDATAENGDADTGAGTASDPYARIQKALDSVNNVVGNMVVIYVAPGTYAAGVYGRRTPLDCHSRVYASHDNCCYRVIATGGAQKTTIVGSGDPNAPAEWNGCSTNAVRCIRSSPGCHISFQGFTLTGGHTSGGEDGIESGNSYGRGGALLSENTERCWLVECIVTNNVAYWAGAAFANGIAVKSYFADNGVVKGGGVFSPQNYGSRGREILSSCVVDQEGLLFDSNKGVMVLNSTLRASATTAILSGHDGDIFNSILVDSADSTANNSSRRMMGNIFWNYRYDGTAARNIEGLNYVTADPLFVDATSGDFRVYSASPAVGGGAAWDGLDASVWSEAVAYSNYYRHIYCDMEGNMPYFVNGKPTVGAYQIPGKASVSVEAHGATISASPAGAVDWGMEVSVTAMDGVRKVMGLCVNGEMMEGATSWTFTPSPDDHANGYAISVIASTNWYVDSENGTSGATGWSTNAAIDTLAHAMAKAEAGDTVYALPGQYRAGSMIHTNSVYSLWYSEADATILLPSRVVVPSGVRLVSTHGASRTFIVGERADSEDGIGEGSMRCVTMENGAYIKGFTLTGGSTLDGRTAYKNEVFDNVSGGGVLCAERPSAPGAGKAPVPTTIVENCVISNNCGRGASGAVFGSYVNCLFIRNNDSPYAVREPQWLYGCVVDENVVSDSAVYQPYYADFCTFGADNRNSAGVDRPALYSCPGSAFWPIRNSLFLGGAKCGLKWAFRCVTPYDAFLTINDGNTPMREGVRSVAVAADEKWRPAAFDSAVVDASLDPIGAEDASFRYEVPDALLREVDIAGGQRIYNGVQDVGAGEFDWRGRYRKDLCRNSRLTVAFASEHAVEIDGQGVGLVDGASLTATWNLSSVRCTYNVVFSGAGTLWLSVNGGEATAVDAAGGSQNLLLPKGENTLAFHYAGDGMATLSEFTNILGLFLTVR